MKLLTQKAQKFEWGQDQKQAFEELKEAFTTPLVLARFDFERDAVVETTPPTTYQRESSPNMMSRVSSTRWRCLAKSMPQQNATTKYTIRSC